MSVHVVNRWGVSFIMPSTMHVARSGLTFFSQRQLDWWVQPFMCCLWLRRYHGTLIFYILNKLSLIVSGNVYSPFLWVVLPNLVRRKRMRKIKRKADRLGNPLAGFLFISWHLTVREVIYSRHWGWPYPWRPSWLGRLRSQTLCLSLVWTVQLVRGVVLGLRQR